MHTASRQEQPLAASASAIDAKIERIETIPLKVKLDRPAAGATLKLTHRCTIVTRVHTDVGVVGGVSEIDFEAYAKVGVRTFGLGSSLFKPGMTVDQVRARAVAAVTAWRVVFEEG